MFKIHYIIPIYSTNIACEVVTFDIHFTFINNRNTWIFTTMYAPVESLGVFILYQTFRLSQKSSTVGGVISKSVSLLPQPDMKADDMSDDELVHTHTVVYKIKKLLHANCIKLFTLLELSTNIEGLFVFLVIIANDSFNLLFCVRMKVQKWIDGCVRLPRVVKWKKLLLVKRWRGWVRVID